MKLHQLRALNAVARFGSLQEAARRIGVTQPAVSKALRELERELGAELLRRTTRGVRLTTLGQAIVQRASAVETEVERIRAEARWHRGEQGGRLVLGLSPPAGDRALTEAIVRFHRRRPDTELQIIETRAPDIFEGLRSGEVDIGIVGQFGSPARTHEFRWRRLYTLDMALMSGTPVSDEAVSLAALADREWLTLDAPDDPSGYIVTLYRAHGLAPPRRIARCSSAPLGYELAARLDVVTCWSRRVLEILERGAGSGMTPLRTIEPLEPIDVFLVHQDEAVFTSAVRDFVRILDDGLARAAANSER